LEGKQEFAAILPLSLTTTRLWTGPNGKLDVGAKLTKGIGVWPAIWNVGRKIIGEVSWPKLGD